ncbi:P-loop containing nucleoside triphosphate hydrolase protein, partial [Jimgerdemannia flammicorona]
MASENNSINVGAGSNIPSNTQHNTNNTSGGGLNNGPITMFGGTPTLNFRAVHNNYSPLSRHASPRAIFDIPEVRNDRFVGRDDIFKKLWHLLDDNRNNSTLGRVALVGLGGMGKTQIALEYCFRNYPSKYEYVFWIMANSKESLSSSFLKVAKLLKLSVTDNESLEVRISLVKNWFHNATKRWLMVFDNADDENVHDFMRNSYPSAGDGDIILTTRDAIAYHKMS